MVLCHGAILAEAALQVRETKLLIFIFLLQCIGAHGMCDSVTISDSCLLILSKGVYTRISYFYDWIAETMCLMNPAAVPDYIDCDDFDLSGEIYGNEIAPGITSPFGEDGTESPSEFGSMSGSSSSSDSSSGTQSPSESASTSGSSSSSFSSSEFYDDDDDNYDNVDGSFFQGIWNWLQNLFR